MLLLIDVHVALLVGAVAATVLLAVVCLLFARGGFAGIARHRCGRLFTAAVLPMLRPPAEVEDAAPPASAQRAGFAITLVGVVLGALGLTPGLVACAALAFVAASLNAVFGLCIGCRLHVLLPRAHLIRPVRLRSA